MGGKSFDKPSLLDDPKIAELLSEVSDFAVFTLDNKGLCTGWQPLSSNYQRLPVEAFIGRSLDDFYPDAQKQQYWDDLEFAVAHGRADGEGWRFRKDGTRSWMRFVMLSRRDDAGELVGFSGVVFDATRQKDTARALHASEEAFRTLVQELTDHAIYTLDPQGIISNWNSGAEHIKGYSAEEIIGKHFSTFYTEEDRLAGEPARSLDYALATGRYHQEGWRVRKGGTLFRAEVVIQPLYDDEEKFVGYGKVTQDISEKYETEAELEETQTALLQSEKMHSLGELTGGIAHDFNNLLTVVRGSAELLSRADLPEEKRTRHIAAIVETADRAAELTGQLLSFARRQPLQPKPVALNDMLVSMTDLLRRSLGTGISILNIPADELWEVNVDPTQLQNLILNAAINARDAMNGSGTLTISTRNISLETGDEVRLSISDTGEGMAEEVREKAFEPFFTTKGPGKGTGLGLSQAYGFAAQSGGRLELASEPGRGTTISLFLPRTNKSGEHAGSDGQAAIQKVPQGTRILLVEDSRTVAMFAQSLLEDMGCLIVHAANAEDAQLVLEEDEQGFDIIFSDIVMPGDSGLDLAAKVRRQRPTLPILLATGYSEAASRGEGSEFPILPKPYKRENLSAMLGKTLSEFSRAA